MQKNLFLPIIANIFGKLSTRNFHIRKKNFHIKKKSENSHQRGTLYIFENKGKTRKCNH